MRFSSIISTQVGSPSPKGFVSRKLGPSHEQQSRPALGNGNLYFLDPRQRRSIEWSTKISTKSKLAPRLIEVWKKASFLSTLRVARLYQIAETPQIRRYASDRRVAIPEQNFWRNFPDVVRNRLETEKGVTSAFS
jgi:hypothetical protein